MISPEQIPDEAAESDYITQWDWHKPLRATPTATTNALPGTGHCHRDEQNARLTAENEKLRAALWDVHALANGWQNVPIIGAHFDRIKRIARAALSGDKHE